MLSKMLGDAASGGNPISIGAGGRADEGGLLGRRTGDAGARPDVSLA